MTELERDAVLSGISKAVYSFAWQWSKTIPDCNRGWVDHEDLYSIGMAKALTVLSTYRDDMGTKLSTYILGCVRNAFQDEVTRLKVQKRQAAMLFVDRPRFRHWHSSDNDTQTDQRQQLEDTYEDRSAVEQTEQKLIRVMDLLYDQPEALELLQRVITGKKLRKTDVLTDACRALQEAMRQTEMGFHEFMQLRSLLTP